MGGNVMKKTLFLALTFLCFNLSHGALIRAAQDGLQDFRGQVAGDPDLGAFEGSALARDILAIHGLKAETYKERLYGAFLAFKTDAALTAAGHAPLSKSHADIKAAVEALAADRDTHQGNHAGLVGRIQVHGGETQVGVAAGGGNLHSDAKLAADVAAGTAAGDVAGRAAANAAIARRITLRLGEDADALVAGGGNFHSHAKHTADVAAARAAGNAAGRASKLAQANTELTTLEAFVTQQATDGHIADAARDAILGDIGRVRAAIA